MDITITIEDLSYPRVRDAIAKNYRYQETIPQEGVEDAPPIPNPESKDKFLIRIMSEFLKNNAVSFEAVTDAEAARDAAEEKAKDEIIVQEKK